MTETAYCRSRQHPRARAARLRSVAAELPGDTAVQAARARAAARLNELGWPSTRDEQWRYANLRAFERLDAFRPRNVAATLDPADLPPPVPGFDRLIFVDGRLAAGTHPHAVGDVRRLHGNTGVAA